MPELDGLSFALGSDGVRNDASFALLSEEPALLMLPVQCFSFDSWPIICSTDLFDELS